MFLWSPMYFLGFEGLNVPEYAINSIYHPFKKQKMAQITIPTQIGGVNLPDFSFGNNPLADLLGNSGQTFFLQYPKDLGTASKAHSVVFTVYEVQEYTLKEIEGFIDKQISTAQLYAIKNVNAENAQELLMGAGDSALSYVDKLLQTDLSKIDVGTVITGLGETAREIVSTGFKLAPKAGDLLSNFGETMTKQKLERKGNIALYMPENFNLTNDYDYDSSTSVASAAGAIPLLGKYISRGTNFVSGSDNDFVKLMMNKGGFVFNPQKQILFNGVEFRNFNMSFTFTPSSERESREVKEIIRHLRMYAAPKQNNQLGQGMFWVPPAIFEIDFKFHDKHNVNLPKLKKCVIKSIDVNYAPNGWAAHGDGAPVQTVITIEFQETSLVDRFDIGSLGY